MHSELKSRQYKILNLNTSTKNLKTNLESKCKEFFGKIYYICFVIRFPWTPQHKADDDDVILAAQSMSRAGSPRPASNGCGYSPRKNVILFSDIPSEISKASTRDSFNEQAKSPGLGKANNTRASFAEQAENIREMPSLCGLELKRG